MQHLQITLTTLRQHQLFAKMSKCKLGSSEVANLEYFISCLGVKANPKKLRAIGKWPIPSPLKSLRGFLGLTGYYRRFIKGYRRIAAPLTKLLKKDGFR